MTRSQISDSEKEAFLEGLANHGNVTRAAREIGRGRQSFYAIRADDSEFSTDWQAADKMYLDSIQERLQVAAMEGYSITTEYFDKEGNLTAKRIETKCDPKLMLRILERRHPDYKPSADLNLDHRPSGVLYVPMPVQSVEEFEALVPIDGS